MKEKGLIIGMLVTVVVVMAVAFAAFSTSLTINGTANVASTWAVAFDETLSTCSDGTKVSVNGTVATFSVSLVSPGDEVTCTITTKNTGTLDAKLSSITATPSGDAPISFTVTPAPGDDLTSRDVLSANGDTETIIVKAAYDNIDSQPEKLEKKITVAATYKQNGVA